jgi:hypothetical protein
MYLRHFLPNDLYFLKDTIQEIITNSTSPPNRCTVTPVVKINLEVDSWTTTCKATTAGSSFGFEDNVCEEALSSQSTHKINSGCLYYLLVGQGHYSVPISSTLKILITLPRQHLHDNLRAPSCRAPPNLYGTILISYGDHTFSLTYKPSKNKHCCAITTPVSL